MKIKPPKNLKNLDKPLSGDVRSEFMDFLLNRGYEYDSKKGLITDGSIGRAYINGDAKTNKMAGINCGWISQCHLAGLAITGFQWINLQQSGSQKTGKDRLSPKLNVKK